MKKVFNDLAGNKVTLRVAKADFTKEIDLGSLAQASVLELLRYGALRWLNDKTAGDSKEEAQARIEMLMEALESDSGFLATVRSGSGNAVTPLEKEVNSIATNAVKAAIQNAGHTLKAVGAKAVADLVKQYISANAELLNAQAQASLDAKANAPKATLDLSSLGL